jgi:hypothetical protein
MYKAHTENQGGAEMRNAYQHLMIGLLALALLWSAVATDVLISSKDETARIAPPSSPTVEITAGAGGHQPAPCYQYISEEIGRTMVPRPRTVQW